MGLHTENVCKKKTPGNMPMELFHGCISIDDSGICSNFSQLSGIYRRIDSVCITISKTPKE